MPLILKINFKCILKQPLNLQTPFKGIYLWGRKPDFIKYLFGEIYFLKNTIGEKKCFSIFISFCQFSDHILKPRNKASAPPQMIFLLHAKCFYLSYLLSSQPLCIFPHFSDLSTGSSILWTGQLIYLQKTHFPLGHILYEIREKGTRGEKQDTGGIFWMFCLLSTRTM